MIFFVGERIDLIRPIEWYRIGSYLATIAWKLPEPWKQLEPLVMGTWKMVSHFISWWIFRFQPLVF